MTTLKFNVQEVVLVRIALPRTGANKLLRKVWEVFITRRDRIVSREHTKTVYNQKKFDAQLQTAQLPAGQKIDNRIDKNLAGLDA